MKTGTKTMVKMTNLPPSPLERIYKGKIKENDENKNEDDGKNYADINLPPSP